MSAHHLHPGILHRRPRHLAVWAAAAIYHGMTVDAVSDLDLSYTPPLGSPWDAVQIAAQTWTRDLR